MDIKKCCKNCANYHDLGLKKHKISGEEMITHCWCDMDVREMCNVKKEFAFFVPAERLVREDEKKRIIKAMKEKLGEI